MPMTPRMAATTVSTPATIHILIDILLRRRSGVKDRGFGIISNQEQAILFKTKEFAAARAPLIF